MSSLFRGDDVLLRLEMYAKIDDPTSRSLWYICAESMLRSVSHVTSLCVDLATSTLCSQPEGVVSRVSFLERQSEFDLHLKGPFNSIDRLIARCQVHSEMYLWHALAIRKLASFLLAYSPRHAGAWRTLMREPKVIDLPAMMMKCW